MEVKPFLVVLVGFILGTFYYFLYCVAPFGPTLTALVETELPKTEKICFVRLVTAPDPSRIIFLILSVYIYIYFLNNLQDKVINLWPAFDRFE